VPHCLDPARDLLPATDDEHGGDTDDGDCTGTRCRFGSATLHVMTSSLLRLGGDVEAELVGDDALVAEALDQVEEQFRGDDFRCQALR